MSRLKTLILAFFTVTLLGAGDNKEHDFEYRQLPLQKIIESLARAQGKSVMFSRAVENSPVTLSLSGVTTQFAMRLVLENYGLLAVPKGDVLHIMTPAERGIASSSPTSIIPLTNVVAREIVDNVKAFIGSGNNVTVSTNDQLNAILISAPDEILVKAKRLITELDQESTQIFIEAKLIESSTSFSRNLGIQWGNGGSGGGIDRATGFSVEAPSANTAFTGVVQAGNLNARLAMGEKSGEVKIISSPKISTLNGTPANIESITTYSVRTTQVVGTTTSATGGLQAVRAGVRLSVTPFLISNDQIRLNIVLSKSDPDFSRQVDSIPGVSDNTANTSLIVRNGQTASIGGLISHLNSTATEGVPILSRLPLIGILFGNYDKKRDDKELMIFITPTVLKGESALWGQAPKKEEGPFQEMEPLRQPAEIKAAAEAAAAQQASVAPLAPASASVPAPAAPAAPAVAEPAKQ